MSTTSMFARGHDYGARATAAVTAFRAVKQTTTVAEDHKVAPAGVGEDAVGIAMCDAAINEVTQVCYTGYGAVEVNAATTNIAAGDKLKPAANGILVKAATAGDKAIATALDPANEDGVIIRVLIEKSVVPAA